MNLTQSDACKFAIDLTSLAIQNNMIPDHGDSKETAEAVYTFCNTLYKKFVDDVSES